MTVNVRGAANLRDVGGLPTADGQHVRPGRLLRSDSLTDLDGPDVSALVDDIGVRLVIDLRAEREAETGRARTRGRGARALRQPAARGYR